MANIKRYDYLQICKDSGFTYLREKNPHIWFQDKSGFTHKMVRTSLAIGSNPSPKSVVKEQLQQYVINELLMRHPNLEDEISFDKFKYVSALDYTTVTCKKHGDYRTKYNWLYVRGNQCMSCANDRRPDLLNMGTEGFIKKSKSVYGNFYDYSKTVYTNCREPVTVTCPIHGDFDIIAYYHSSGGNGCPDCGLENGAMGVNSYRKSCPNGASVYVLEMSNSEEVFIKVGISKNVKSRADEVSRVSKTSVKILHTVSFTDAGDAWYLEKDILSEFAEHKYNPAEPFNGNSECINICAKDEVLKLIKCLG